MKIAQQHLGRGTVLGNRYEIQEALGQGGMAYVYLALDRENRRRVALKLMREELSDDPEFIRRFATEARAAASLDHPNIVRVLDYGQDNNVRYIVQEYVEGTTLKELIEEQGALPWNLAIPLMIQIGLALEHAHRRGIIHRDMKPQNVLITPQMIAKVTDFGIARARNANTITLTGGVAFGSVHYFSPEQARGGNVTERSDLYSLGIMLYEMLTGTLPFDGESSVAVAIKQLQEMPLRPSSLQSDLPRALDDIIFKAIQKSPERRYQGARTFVDELGAFLHNPQGRYGVIHQGGQDWNSGTSAISLSSGDANFYKVDELERNIDRRRRRRVRDAVLIFLLLAAAAVGIYYLLHFAFQRINLSVGGSSQSDVIVVERYLGKKLSEVQDELYAIYGSRVELEAVKSETLEEGVIFEQSPDYGTKLPKAEASIHLKYSLGKEVVMVPEIVGIQEDLARERLKAAKLNPLIRNEVSKEVPKGNVIRSSPEVGATLSAGSDVTVWISLGESSGRMPDLIDRPWKEALELLKASKVEVDAVNLYQDPNGNPVEVPEEDRVVLEQFPEMDSPLQEGQHVTLKYGASEEYMKNSGYGGKLIMPNLIGKSYEEAQWILASMWPAGGLPYSFSYLGGYGPSDPGLVVMQQTVTAGANLDPYHDYLYVYLGRP